MKVEFTKYEAAIGLPAKGCVHVWQLGGHENLDNKEQEFSAPAAKKFDSKEIDFVKSSSSFVKNQIPPSRVILQKIVSLYTGCDCRDVIFSTSDRGKPGIISPPGLHFSLTHTQGVMLAVFSRSAVGLDVENSRRKVDAEKIALRYFPVEEKNLVMETPEERRSENFLRIWIRKESAVKLAGDGLAFGLEKAKVGLTGKGRYGDSHDVYFQEFGTDNYLAAVASFEDFEVKGWFAL